MAYSRQLIRTTPALTSNYKLVITDSDYQLFLESFNSNAELSTEKYKHFRINESTLLSDALVKFYDKLPKEKAFFVKNNVPADIVLDEYELQYDDMYWAGASQVEDTWYDNAYEWHAPVILYPWDMPEGFVIFRIDGPGVTDYDVVDLCGDFNQTLLSAWKGDRAQFVAVSYFDLTNKSKAGRFLNNNFSADGFPQSPFEFSSGKYQFSRWNGIEYETGGFCSKSKMIDAAISGSTTHFDFEDFVTSSFATEGVIVPHIINAKFLFDDSPVNYVSNSESGSVKNWSMNRYLGFYVKKRTTVKSFSPYPLVPANDEIYIKDNVFTTNYSDAEANSVNPFTEEFQSGKRYFYKIDDDFAEVVNVGGVYKMIHTDIVDTAGFAVNESFAHEGQLRFVPDVPNNRILLKYSNGNDVFIPEPYFKDRTDFLCMEIFGKMYAIHSEVVSIANGQYVWYIKSDDVIRSEGKYVYIYRPDGTSDVIDVEDIQPGELPVVFPVYSMEMLPVHDLDFDRVDTGYSRYEYEMHSTGTDTAEPKLYAPDRRVQGDYTHYLERLYRIKYGSDYVGSSLDAITYQTLSSRPTSSYSEGFEFSSIPSGYSGTNITISISNTRSNTGGRSLRAENSSVALARIVTAVPVIPNSTYDIQCYVYYPALVTQDSPQLLFTSSSGSSGITVTSETYTAESYFDEWTVLRATVVVGNSPSGTIDLLVASGDQTGQDLFFIDDVSISDRGYSSKFFAIPVASEYAAGEDLFVLDVKDKLSSIWDKSPKSVKWSFSGSLSHADYPYKLNISEHVSGFSNRAPVIGAVTANRPMCNLDWFYIVGRPVTINMTLDVSNNNRYTFKDYVFSSLNVTPVDNAALTPPLSTRLNTFVGDTKLYSANALTDGYERERFWFDSRFDLDTYGSAYSPLDVFSYFFSQPSEEMPRTVTKKYSAFTQIDDGDTSYTVFKGMRLNIWKDVSTNDERIGSKVNLEGYKFSSVLTKRYTNDSDLYGKSGITLYINEVYKNVLLCIYVYVPFGSMTNFEHVERDSLYTASVMINQATEQTGVFVYGVSDESASSLIPSLVSVNLTPDMLTLYNVAMAINDPQYYSGFDFGVDYVTIGSETVYIASVEDPAGFYVDNNTSVMSVAGSDLQVSNSRSSLPKTIINREPYGLVPSVYDEQPQQRKLERKNRSYEEINDIRSSTYLQRFNGFYEMTTKPVSMFKPERVEYYPVGPKNELNGIYGFNCNSTLINPFGGTYDVGQLTIADELFSIEVPLSWVVPIESDRRIKVGDVFYLAQAYDEYAADNVPGLPVDVFTCVQKIEPNSAAGTALLYFNYEPGSYSVLSNGAYTYKYLFTRVIPCSGNNTFDRRYADFGLTGELHATKVNHNGSLNANASWLHAMLNRHGVSTKRNMVFKSCWDNNFFMKTLQNKYIGE